MPRYTLFPALRNKVFILILAGIVGGFAYLIGGGIWSAFKPAAVQPAGTARAAVVTPVPVPPTVPEATWKALVGDVLTLERDISEQRTRNNQLLVAMAGVYEKQDAAAGRIAALETRVTVLEVGKAEVSSPAASEPPSAPIKKKVAAKKKPEPAKGWWAVTFPGLFK